MRVEQAKPAPSTYYTVEATKLLVGDIIVTTTSDKVSRGIRIATFGKFSHVTIYAGSGYYLDATSNGVQSNLLSRMLLEKPSYGKVLRLKVALTDAERNRIVSLVRYHIGKEYSVPQAMIAGIPGQPQKSDSSNRQFCSRLVAEAYAASGHQIVRNASFCTPQQVNKSAALFEFPDCIRLATSNEVALAQAPDAGLTEIVKTTHNEVLRRARELTGNDIQEFTTFSKFATSHPEYDQGLADILRSTGYLDLWQIEYQEMAFLYDPDKFKQQFTKDEERHAAAIHFNEKNESVLPHYSETYETLKAEFAKRQSITVGLEIDLYEQLLRLYRIRKDVFQPYLNRNASPEEERWAHMPPELLKLRHLFFK